MEKARIAHEVFNTVCSRTQPHRDTVAAHQIPLVTFFCVSMYGGTARGIGTYLERFWVKIPDYFCLSTYTAVPGRQHRAWVAKSSRDLRRRCTMEKARIRHIA